MTLTLENSATLSRIALLAYSRGSYELFSALADLADLYPSRRPLPGVVQS